MKEKSLPLAIGLNLLLPGVGYLYMGKWLVGIFACLLVIGIFATTGLLFLMPTWIGMNVIMAINMVFFPTKTRRKSQKPPLQGARVVRRQYKEKLKSAVSAIRRSLQRDAQQDAVSEDPAAVSLRSTMAGFLLNQGGEVRQAN